MNASPNDIAPWRFKITNFGKASPCKAEKSNEAKRNNGGNRAYSMMLLVVVAVKGTL